MPKALLYGVPYDLFWHLNPSKLIPFRKAYEERLEQEERARWMNGMYIMQAISACFGEKYPEKPLFVLGNISTEQAQERAEHDGYTQEEIDNAREALVMKLEIMEGRNRRAKAREERQRLREQQKQESESE